jgi:hypothetical protein
MKGNKGKTMTLTINVSPETARRIADDPEALRRAGERIDANRSY